MKWGRLAGQGLLIVLLAWFVGGALRQQWAGFQSADLQVHLIPGWLLVSAGLAFLTFGILIQSWRLILHGWDQELSLGELSQIWFLANLGRYVPGKVWSVAGLIVLAARRGVAAWAASAAAVVVQALGLASAVAVTALTLPAAASGVRVLAAGAVAVVVTVALTSRRIIDTVGRRVPRLAGVRALPPGALAAASGFALAGWCGYGASLWALSRGLGQGDALSLGAATGGFALAYTAGLVALFAPGGLVVREGVLVALLAPQLGAGPALALSLGSRIMLTAAELLAATPFVISWMRSTPRARG